MFTGIVEAFGKVVSIETQGANHVFEIESTISSKLKVDQSLSHEGVCLTVIKVKNGRHFVTAVEETLQKSNLGKIKPGAYINLERAMMNNSRFDGHIVQGISRIFLLRAFSSYRRILSRQASHLMF